MPICEGCGFSYDDSFKYCPQCGREKPEPKEIKVVLSEDASKNSCPICHTIDKVEKVTEIRRYQIQDLSGTVPVSQTHTDSKGKVSSSTSLDYFSGTQASRLAQALKPPDEPFIPAKHSLVTFFLWVGVVLSGFWFLCSIVVSITNNQVEFLFPLGLAVVLVILLINRSNRENDEYKINTEKYDQARPIWMKSMQKWEQLYYCFRDGCVFFPGTNTFAPVEKMMAYIYSSENEKPEPPGKPCPACSYSNRSNNQYCINCGEKLR